jgi:hypothetical protein
MIVKQIKTPKLPNCDSELHLRIPKEVEDEIQRLANVYKLKKSTFVRMMIMQEIGNYDPSQAIAH